MKTVRRLLSVIVVLALVLGAYVLVRLQPWAQVDVPPADASPQQVVLAYTQAESAHDLGTMHEISEDDALVPSWIDVLLMRGPRFTDITVDEPRRHDTQGTRAEDWRQATFVPVEMTVTKGSDGGFSDGRQHWGYVLVRNADDEPWRIIDQGAV